MTERLRPAALTLGPALPVLAVMIWWSADEGGYAPTKWYPVAILLAGLLAAVALGRGALPKLRRPTLVALGALAAYTAWSYLSIVWAQAPGDALEGANRCLLYLAVFALFSILPWRGSHADVALWLFIGGAGVVALVTAIRLGTADDPSAFYIDGRLASPLGYQNADAALWTTLALLGLVQAARREVAVPLRALGLGLAVLGLDLAVLSQSRGWLYTLPVVLLVVLAIVPRRVRLVVFAAPVAIVVGISAPTLLHVFERASDVPFGRDGFRPAGPLASALADTGAAALRTMLIGMAACALAGLVLALADRRRPERATTPALGPRGGAVLAVVLVIAAVGGGLVATGGHPVRKLDAAWSDFKDYEHADAGANTRYGTLGTSRYDFWRVGVDVWRDHPLQGIGQDNFAEAYIADRQSREEPRWVHSLELRAMVHTGVVGLLLLIVFLVAAAIAGLSREIRRGPWGMTQAGCLVPVVVWVVHGSLDWFWEYPGLTLPALAFLAIAGSMAAGDERAAGRRRTAVAFGVLCALAGLALVPPYVAAYKTRAAQLGWPADPAAALRQVHRATGMNPLSERAPLLAGVIELRTARLVEARSDLAEAAQRRPKGWYIRLQQAIVESRTDHPHVAAARLRQAIGLNPRDAVLRAALRRVRKGQRLDPGALDRSLSGRTARRVGHRPK